MRASRKTAHAMISRPDLVHLDRTTSESGADLKRLDLPAGIDTGIWWYAKFPEHYAEEGAGAPPAQNELLKPQRIQRMCSGRAARGEPARTDCHDQDKNHNFGNRCGIAGSDSVQLA